MEVVRGWFGGWEVYYGQLVRKGGIVFDVGVGDGLDVSEVFLGFDDVDGGFCSQDWDIWVGQFKGCVMSVIVELVVDDDCVDFWMDIGGILFGCLVFFGDIQGSSFEGLNQEFY